MTAEQHIKNSLKEFKPTSQKIDLFDWTIQDTSTQFFKIKDKKGNRFKLFAFSERIRIQTSIKTSLLFAINLPDKICLAKEPLNNKTGNKVYTNHTQDDAVVICLELITKDVHDLRLEHNEGLFIYRNALQLLVNKTRPLVSEILTLHNIKSVIESTFPDSPQTIDNSKIPEDLQDLIPFLSKWAISDDTERQEKVDQSSKATLKKIMEIVYPKMNLIDDYLNSFKSEPLPYEAILIQDLAQLVMEQTFR